VARSWFYYRRQPRRPRPLRRPQLTGAIQQVLTQCPPSYGYRRIHALLARQGIRCNRKTVYQHLKRQAWLASHRYRAQRPGRRHEGNQTRQNANPDGRVIPYGEGWGHAIT
jgi:IS30 family transposase